MAGGTRGPKPKPTNLHVVGGNRSKLPLNKLLDVDGVHPVVEIPEPPSFLTPSAKVEWLRISVELEALGLISKLDMAALAVYCQAYARYVLAEEKLAEKGDAAMVERTPSGYQQIGVWLQISNRSVEQMHKFLAEFGMTPSSRSRVTPSQQMQGDLFNGNGSEGSGAKKYF
jgi:P27 family predicted phage terminase small subunit